MILFYLFDWESLNNFSCCAETFLHLGPLRVSWKAHLHSPRASWDLAFSMEGVNQRLDLHFLMNPSQHSVRCSPPPFLCPLRAEKLIKQTLISAALLASCLWWPPHHPNLPFPSSAHTRIHAHSKPGYLFHWTPSLLWVKWINKHNISARDRKSLNTCQGAGNQCNSHHWTPSVPPCPALLPACAP